MVDLEGGGVRDVLVAAVAKEVALAMGGQGAPVGLRRRFEPEPRLSGMGAETVLVVIVRGRQALGHEQVAHALVRVEDEIPLDVATDRDVVLRARQAETARVSPVVITAVLRVSSASSRAASACSRVWACSARNRSIPRCISCICCSSWRSRSPICACADPLLASRTAASAVPPAITWPRSSRPAIAPAPDETTGFQPLSLYCVLHLCRLTCPGPGTSTLGRAGGAVFGRGCRNPWPRAPRRGVLCGPFTQGNDCPGGHVVQPHGRGCPHGPGARPAAWRRAPDPGRRRGMRLCRSLLLPSRVPAPLRPRP